MQSGWSGLPGISALDVAVRLCLHEQGRREIGDGSCHHPHAHKFTHAFTRMPARAHTYANVHRHVYITHIHENGTRKELPLEKIFRWVKKGRFEASGGVLYGHIPKPYHSLWIVP